MSCRAVLAGLPLVPLALSAVSAHAAEWQSIGPDGGRIDGFAQCASVPGRMVALPHRLGVARSDDAGATWSRVDTGLPMDSRYEAAAISPFDEDLLLVAVPQSDQVLRSTDGGVTWTTHATGAAWTAVEEITFDPHSPGVVLLAATRGAGKGLWRSLDFGMTWSPANNGITTLDPLSIAFHPSDPGVVLVGTSNGAYRSTNWGTSWTPVNTSGNSYVSAISFCAGTPTRAWATGEVDGVIRSDDEGLSFSALAVPYSCGYVCSMPEIAAAPDDPDVVIVGELLWSCVADCVHWPFANRSTDGGATWPRIFSSPEAVRENQEYSALVFHPSGNGEAYLALGNEGSTTAATGLWRSTDSGGTWSASMQGIRGVRITGTGRDAAGDLYVRDAGATGLWRADSSGGWIPRTATRRPIDFEVNRRAAGLLYQTSGTPSSDTFNPEFAWSTDAGQTWAWTSLPTTSFFPYPSLVVSNHGDGGTVYVFADDGIGTRELSRRDPGQTLFTLIGNPPFMAAGAAVDPGDPMRVFAVSDAAPGEVFLTTDGGATWSPRSTGLPSDPGVDLFMDPGDADRLAAVFRTSGAWRSDDGGLSWSPVPGSPGAVPVIAADWDPVADRFFFATQDSGAYASDLGWINDGLRTRDLTSVTWDAAAQRVLLGTDHAGLQALDVAAGAVAAAGVAPRADRLALRASPNPFAGSTRLELTVPRDASETEVAVFAVDGRRVATLLRGPVPAGSSMLTWNGRDDSGAAAGAGVYFARLSADGETVTRRIVLLAR